MGGNSYISFDVVANLGVPVTFNVWEGFQGEPLDFNRVNLEKFEVGAVRIVISQLLLYNLIDFFIFLQFSALK